MTNRNLSLLVLAAGTTAAIALPAAAQPASNGTTYPTATQINVTGATLLSNLFQAPAISNDFIDADGNGVARRFGTNQNLAPIGYPPATAVWAINYAETGSVAGLQELITFGTVPAAIPSQVTASRSAAFYNRQRYIGSGSIAGLANTGNYGQAPTSQISALDLHVIDPTLDPGWAGVYRNDVAPLDVPARWGVLTTGGSPDFSLLPGQAGYGNYALKPVSRTGVTITGGTNKLANLDAPVAQGGPANLFDESNPAAANNRTIFDTPILFAPIAPIVNFGVGKQTTSMTELRHLFATGRLPSGENLVAVTRESGSGTRNGFMNSLAIDPSWGRGDGTGSTFAADGNSQDAGRPAEGNLGPNFVSTNKTGTGDVESTVFNHRLSIGYVGAERAVNNSWGRTTSISSVARAEILGVTHDLLGGATPVRPTAGAVLDNDPAAGGWTIGGPASLSTMGDPRSAPAAKGGYGYDVLDVIPAPARPAMPNIEAAAFVNNITRSLEAFIANAESDTNLFTPGEFMANNYLLLPSQDKVHSATNPSAMLNNDKLNAGLQDYIRARSAFVYNNSFYTAFGNGGNGGVSGKINGRAPTRTSPGTYSDGADGFYHDMNNTQVAYNGAAGLTDRNRVAGDFNGDALRNIDDASDMVKAWRHRNTVGFTWTPPTGTGAIAGAPGSDVCIEIIGDFNGDGSFDAADLRYFADGLAMLTSGPAAGKLDRKAGFTAIDAQFGATAVPAVATANFFGTTKATNKPWANGDSRGDIAGAPGVAPGWAPVGASGSINAADIDYLFKQFQTNVAATIVPNLGKQVDWDNLNQAVTFDLSADMNGDRKVDYTDAQELVNLILLTNFGDVNLDGVVNSADLAIANSWITGGGGSSRPGGWANGDVNGDGVVDAADITIITRAQCLADVAGLGGSLGANGSLEVDDIVVYLNQFFANNLLVADIAGLGGTEGRDGQMSVDDLVLFLNRFFAGCP